MFAALAALVFFLALLGLEFGKVNMLVLGLLFMAIQMMLGTWWPANLFRRPNPNA